MYLLLSPDDSDFAIDLADAIFAALPPPCRDGRIAARVALYAMTRREQWGRA